MGAICDRYFGVHLVAVVMLNWIGFQLLMRFDAAINPYTRFGRWCLVRAGNHAYGQSTQVRE